MLSKQITFFGEDSSQIDTTSTFSDSLSLPVHRWIRYSAGFSALWVRELLHEQRNFGRTKVLDPFAGSGTVLLEAESSDIHGIGIEAHPLVARIARAKLLWRLDAVSFKHHALSICKAAQRRRGSVDYPPLILKCFPHETLLGLDSLRRTWQEVADGSPESELTWLALTSILRKCSPVGTAQWQYVLPKKRKVSCLNPYEAFETKIYLMAHDMLLRQAGASSPSSTLLQGDARKCLSIPEEWADLVVTSPPYANNYDYADATRLEMSFYGEISGWGDLQDTVRKYLIRSCTQHVAGMNAEIETALEDSCLEPIRGELGEAHSKLEKERDKHGGKKAYHAMIVAYFRDMADVWLALRRVTARNCLACFVIGDSAPYGIHIPVERWLGELAIAAGFRSFRFEKTRDRNIKWKNRKHRVPLHEGRLWVEG